MANGDIRVKFGWSSHNNSAKTYSLRKFITVAIILTVIITRRRIKYDGFRFDWHDNHYGSTRKKKGLFWDRLHHIQFVHIPLMPQITEFSYLKKKKKKKNYFFCFEGYVLLTIIFCCNCWLSFMFWWNGTQRCRISGQAGKWSGCSSCLPSKHHPYDPFQDLTSHQFGSIDWPKKNQNSQYILWSLNLNVYW